MYPVTRNIAFSKYERSEPFNCTYNWFVAECVAKIAPFGINPLLEIGFNSYCTSNVYGLKCMLHSKDVYFYQRYGKLVEVMYKTGSNEAFAVTSYFSLRINITNTNITLIQRYTLAVLRKKEQKAYIDRILMLQKKRTSIKHASIKGGFRLLYRIHYS